MPFTSTALLWREYKQNLKLYGSKCNACSFVQYPQRRVCLNCSTKDEMEDFKLSKHGRVFTYTVEHLFPSVDPPLVMAVVDLEGGGRIYLQMTDCYPEVVKVGMLVELTFRILHESGGFYNYYWKCRPIPESSIVNRQLSIDN